MSVPVRDGGGGVSTVGGVSHPLGKMINTIEVSVVLLPDGSVNANSGSSNLGFSISSAIAVGVDIGESGAVP